MEMPEEVKNAADVVYRFAIKTPVFRDRHMSLRIRRDVLLKMETFQPVHSFKIRGATNKLCRIEEKKVITASSGNHGIAVAYVCSELGKEATVVVPENVNKAKLRMIRELGAETIAFGNSSDERISYARKLSKQTGAPLIPSFDDIQIIAGQGTAGLEIEPPDVLICPVGGGGLIAGIASALTDKKTRIFGVQPEGAAAMAQSLQLARQVSIKAKTIADGIAVETPGKLPLEIVRNRVEAILTVSDEEIIDAFREMWEYSHVLMEPASASTVAALVRYKERILRKEDRSVMLIISGANVSDEALRLLV
ncbi:MAG: threonine/serine dehydratase [Methanomassiliicoccales archaeon]